MQYYNKNIEYIIGIAWQALMISISAHCNSELTAITEHC